MVAISLYRGNLHKLPQQQSPRTWLLPIPRISLEDFRRLILRRSNSLSLLPSSSSAPGTNPNFGGELLVGFENPNLCPERIVDDAVMVDTAENIAEDKEEEEGAYVDDRFPTSQGNGSLDAIDEKEKREREVEEKLQILNEKKHNLVQALKQILNAEEELMRRSNVQENRPPLPLQADASNDSGSMTRHIMPRTGSDVNVTLNKEVGEGDDAVNHISQPRQLLHLNS